ncbi:MAG: hypothetical protein AAF723_05270 [Pseudomonadota bacterium]
MSQRPVLLPLTAAFGLLAAGQFLSVAPGFGAFAAKLSHGDIFGDIILEGEKKAPSPKTDMGLKTADPSIEKENQRQVSAAAIKLKTEADKLAKERKALAAEKTRLAKFRTTDHQRLAEIYTQMPPDKAASIMSALSPEEAATFIGLMPGDAGASILAAMPSKSAVLITRQVLKQS